MKGYWFVSCVFQYPRAIYPLGTYDRWLEFESNGKTPEVAVLKRRQYLNEPGSSTVSY